MQFLEKLIIAIIFKLLKMSRMKSFQQLQNVLQKFLSLTINVIFLEINFKLTLPRSIS